MRALLLLCVGCVSQHAVDPAYLGATTLRANDNETITILPSHALRLELEDGEVLDGHVADATTDGGVLVWKTDKRIDLDQIRAARVTTHDELPRAVPVIGALMLVAAATTLRIVFDER